ncbi:MAG: hypothetical protein L0Y72_20615 [Gemmataceae bacterium]|nr:hypothetical protein [Gemmataceae bacterium]MCI0741443.1 hypothetical protein [Gemmataceae bacterium]
MHAAMEASRQFLSTDSDHPHLVLCGVASEVRLLAAADHLHRHDIRSALFREPDRANEVTALATEPLTAEKRRFLHRFRCLSRQDFLVVPDLKHEPRGSCRERF